MRVCIHRGSAEIGGSCVELEQDGRRLVLDLGLPLDADLRGDLPLPPVPGLAAGDPSLEGVLISHAHPDHYGLAPRLHPSVPLYLGEATQRILSEAAFFSPAGAELRAAGYLRDREPLRLGPFTVTPFLMDHSAFDAYALLVEAGGRRLLYSGDLRAHGRKSALFERLIAEPPPDVDVLLLEGTNLRAEDQRGGRAALSERELEARCVELFTRTSGMVLAAYSAQNIDRLVTLHRAARRSGRSLVLDLYATAIAKATGRPATIPQGDWDSTHVFVPQSQRVRVKQAGEFERVNDIRTRRLYPEDLAPRASQLVMTIRGSMTGDLERANCLAGAHTVWSMWPGYLDQPSGVKLRAWLDGHGIPLTVLHSSGHATVSDLQRFADAVGARSVVPIHTHNADRYPAYFENVVPRADGEWWQV